MNFDFNQLPKNRRLMILDFLKSPSRKRALALLKDTPIILLVADTYFSKTEIVEHLKKIVTADLEREYIFEFLEHEICSQFGCELSSLQFILNYGSKSNCRIAKKINLEQKLL